MRLNGEIFILAKVERPWTDENGVSRTSFAINISQLDGQIIETLRLTQAQFQFVEAKKNYVITADYGVGKNGGYLRLVDISPTK